MKALTVWGAKETLVVDRYTLIPGEIRLYGKDEVTQINTKAAEQIFEWLYKDAPEEILNTILAKVKEVGYGD